MGVRKSILLLTVRRLGEQHPPGRKTDGNPKQEAKSPVYKHTGGLAGVGLKGRTWWLKTKSEQYGCGEGLEWPGWGGPTGKRTY